MKRTTLASGDLQVRGAPTSALARPDTRHFSGRRMAPDAKLVLTNEAGMLLITSHFTFWNRSKAGMLMKINRLAHVKPECY